MKPTTPTDAQARAAHISHRNQWIVSLWSNGTPPPVIAKIVNCSASTVRRLQNKMVEQIITNTRKRKRQ